MASSFLYVRKSARVAVVGGTGKWGLTGTGWRTGLLAVSRTDILESTSTSVSRAARLMSHPRWPPCRPSSLRLVSSASFCELGPNLLYSLSFMTR